MNMDFRRLFPLPDFGNSYTFDKCLDLKDFLHETVAIYFAITDHQPEVIASCLSVYLAIRERHPEMIKSLDQKRIEHLDAEVERIYPNIVPFHNRVVNALSKVG